MQDDTLNNILNILQGSNNSGSNQQNNSGNNSNNLDLQNLLIKLLLSGGLNNIFPKQQADNITSEPPKPRTINLENYKRLD